MEEILTAAFIIAVTAFIKEQFNVSGRMALLCAFIVALVIGFAPLVGAQFPALAPWIEQLIRVIVLFLSAAGGWDALQQFKRLKAEPLNAKGPQPK